jgi:hypothetical protein
MVVVPLYEIAPVNAPPALGIAAFAKSYADLTALGVAANAVEVLEVEELNLVTP